MIRLIDVYSMDAEKVLYKLLAERDPVANISHKEMPTMEEHRAFVRRMPYLHWYLIQDWPTYEDAVFGEIHPIPAWIGAIYITKDREVGIAIFKAHQGKSYGTVAMKELMEKHPGKLYANIAPGNDKSIEFFKRFGAKLIQHTYLMES